MATQPPINVQAIRPAPQAVEPPEGWMLRSKFGILRCDDTPAGRLVRFADLVQWLMDSRELPRVDAVNLVCTSINQDAIGWLYFLQPGGFAKVVEPSGFARLIPGDGPVEKRMSDRFISEMQRLWGDVNQSNQVLRTSEILCASLACTIAQAHVLWGYGRVQGAASESAEDAAPASRPIHALPWKAQHTDWDGARLLKEKTIQKAKSIAGHMQRLSTISGLPVREITRRIHEHQKTLSAGMNRGKKAA